MIFNLWNSTHTHVCVLFQRFCATEGPTMNSTKFNFFYLVVNWVNPAELQCRLNSDLNCKKKLCSTAAEAVSGFQKCCVGWQGRISIMRLQATSVGNFTDIQIQSVNYIWGCVSVCFCACLCVCVWACEWDCVKMMRKLVMRPKFRMCVCMTERERRSASEMCLCVTDSE